MNLHVSPQAAASELLRRRAARSSLIGYAKYIEVPGAPVDETDEDSEDFLPVETTLAAHHELILAAADRCISRPYGRTMLFLPPGSAKSTYGSIVVPSYAMGKKPNYRVIAASYGSDLARKMGRRTRSIVKQRAYQALFDTSLSSDSSAADEWALTNGSEYMSGGILSGMTGNRAHFLVIDDPIKGRQQADSEQTRKTTYDAYEDDLKTRLVPGGSIMLIQTRWHEMDIAGQILPENYNGESGVIACRDGMDWEVICIPARAERHDDPLGRKAGEYLWTEWFDQKHWAQFERNPRTWAALYQQRPAPDEGDYFKREWIKIIDELPPLKTLNVYGGSDYAVTADGGDYTVHAVVGIGYDDKLYLLDLWRKQSASDEWIEAFCDLVIKWKPIGWAEETGQIKSALGPQIDARQRARKAYVHREVFPTRGGNKAVRAQAIRGRMALDGLYVSRSASFLADFIRELLTFPVGVNDDQVDALGLIGQLLNKMFAKTEPKQPDPQKTNDYKYSAATENTGDWMTY